MGRPRAHPLVVDRRVAVTAGESHCRALPGGVAMDTIRTGIFIEPIDVTWTSGGGSDGWRYGLTED
jgi:hypothetical protein